MMDTEKRKKIVREFERFIQEYCRDIGCTSYDIEVLKGAFALLAQPVTISRWVKLTGDFTTPGGTPYFVCGRCGGSGHLYGVEYSKRKVLCDGCGSVNIYPWERAHEEGTALWEDPKEARSE
jgi:hypothetical protein